jgi:REP-associated tyrosine transposase
VRALAKIRERYGFVLVGYVVMPEHVHLLIGEAPKCTPSLVLKVLKQRVSRDLRKRRRGTSTRQMRLPFREGEAGLPRFWQPRFYDFNVYSAKKIREKLEYMHANPVKRGLVENPAEWVWSSYLDYEKGQKGLVPIDFTD